MEWSPHITSFFLVLPTLEYCCLNWFCNPFKSKTIGLSTSYHNLASPTNLKQNIWTFTPSWNECVSIQSLVLRRWASASSSGLPMNSGLKWDQFNWGIGSGWIGCVGGTIGCGGGAGGCTGGAGGTTGGLTGSGWGAGGPPTAMSIHNADSVAKHILILYLTLPKSFKWNPWMNKIMI